MTQRLRGFPARSEELDATEAFRVYLGGERRTEYRAAGRPDPPDLVLEEQATGRRIAVEHTRIIEEDLPYVAAWYRFYDMVKAEGPLPGQFFIRPDIRAPLPQPGRELSELARATSDAIRRADWRTVKSLTVPGEQGIKVVLIEATGSDIVGIRPHAYFPRWERISRLGALIARKLAKCEGLNGYDERLLLVEVTYVSEIETASCRELIVDEIEWARLRHGTVPVDSVYLIRSGGRDAPGRFDTELVWPAR